MKKQLIIAGLAAAVLAVVSCEKVSEETLVPQPETEVTPAEPETGDAVFTLEATYGELTKTSLSDLAVSWSEGDQIVVNGVASKPLAADKIKSSGSATFEFDEVLTAPYEAVYPASAYVADSYASGEAEIVLPTEQTYSAGSFDPAAAVMLGTGTDGVAFTHSVAYLKLIFDKDVKSVRVMANNGQRVRGRMKANFGSEALENYYTTSNYNTVTLDCGTGAAAGEPVIVAIPAKSYVEGINVFVVTTDGQYQILRTGALDLSSKAGVLIKKETSLSALKTYQGPGIYCETDWNSFVCADESKFTNDETQKEDASAWIGSDGEVNIYEDFTVANNLQRHGSNFAAYPDATNNIYFTETLDGNGHTLTQNASTVPLIAWLGSATESGVVKNLTLAGNCTSLGNTGWSNAAFAIRIFRKGELNNCTNAINTTYTETTAAHGNLYFAGLALSNGGLITGCKNTGNMDITLISDAERIFDLGGIAGVNRYDNSCGDFVNCVNEGNLTIIKKAEGDAKQSLKQCGIAGICATVAQGVPGTQFTGVYSRFNNCSNIGEIKFWEEKSGAGSTTQLAVGIGGIIGISTKYASDVPSLASNDEGYYFIVHSCYNKGTIDVSSGNNKQAMATGMSGARQTYIGGLVGFAMGSNNSETARSSTYYAIIRGYNDATIKLGSEVGCEAAGGLLGGGGFVQFDYLSSSNTVFAKSENPDRTPAKAGAVGALAGWIVKRSLAFPKSTIELRMDASGLDGLTVYGQGILGVTSVTSKNASGGIETDSKKWNASPLIIFENGTSGTTFNFALKYADGSTEPAASLAAGFQTSSTAFYGNKTSSGGPNLRSAGNVKIVDF